MTKLRDIYKCNVCGNVVEIAHEGAGTLVCCGQPMENLIAKTADPGKEKHVPVVKECENGICVEVGDVHHPMEEKHYIKFVEVLTSSKVIRAELVPGQKPTAEFNIDKGQVLAVRCYCNLHGLWLTK